MKQRNRSIISILMAVVLLGSSGCSRKSEETELPETKETAAEAEKAVINGMTTQNGAERKPGDIIGGFTLETVEESTLLNSTIYNFYHEQSGARLVYLQNEDKDMAFSIAYHTPYVDETDMNHIFEHAILASSEKYPSKDLFFDLYGKTYNTFVNAFTYNDFTCYPVSSQSQEQLMKMADVYLSCMTAPEILTNENFFKREALRYELYEKEGPITMTGTVYSEDFGFLTDTGSEASNNILDALYPGEYTANAIGRLHRNYPNLTYENTLQTYHRYYHFDNSLILLYGDMDYEAFMKFIDEEYLSKEEKHGTDLSPWIDAQTESGYVEQIVPSPAYEGDRTGGMSQIDYAIDLSGKDWSELFAWCILGGVLDSNASVLGQEMQEAGITSPYSVTIDLFSAKPNLLFSLYYTEADQMTSFRELICSSLKETAEEGVDPELLSSILKSEKISLSLLRDQSAAGVECFPSIINYWTHTGKVNFYTMVETTLETLEEDTEQKLLKRLAKEALTPARSALVATVPTPGLAEEIEAEAEAYLTEMKASMTEEELEQLIRDTEEFNAWNESENSNSDFMISPKDLPEPEAPAAYTVVEEEGLTIYHAAADTEELAGYSLLLDTSALTEEQTRYLNLYLMLIGELDTSAHSAEEIQILMDEYLYGLTMEYLYPAETAGENSHPMLSLQWHGQAEDFEQSLSLLLEIISDSDTSDAELISYLLARDMDGCDLSKQDPYTLAKNKAMEHGGLEANSYRYGNAVDSQEFYEFLKTTEAKLSASPEAFLELSERMKEAVDLMLVKGRVILLTAAPKQQQEAISKSAAEQIGALPDAATKEIRFHLPETAKKRGVKVESSDYYTVVNSALDFAAGMKGSYFPFISAIEDRYLTPKLRFQMGAYSASAGCSVRNQRMGVISYSDPNVAETIDVILGMTDFLRSAKLTQEDFNGYILNCYGGATAKEGMLSGPMNQLRTMILGGNLEEANRQTADIRNAVLDMQEQAADAIETLLDHCSLVTVGNSAKIDSSADYFDEVVDYRTK